MDNAPAPTVAQLLETVRQLHEQVADLTRRVGSLEKQRDDAASRESFLNARLNAEGL